MQRSSLHKQPYKSNTQKGFTLIEVMVALMIFAFAASSLTVGFQASVNASIRAEQNIQANMVAQYQTQRVVLSGKTDKNSIKPEMTLNMFDKKWKITQEVQALNEYRKVEEETSDVELDEFEDFEIYSDSFNSSGDDQAGFKLDIPDSYIVYTINVTPEDELGHATMQTLLIKGLLQ